MRFTICLALACLAQLVPGAPGASAEEAENAPIAFGAIGSLRQGDVLAYRLKVPMSGFVGSGRPTVEGGLPERPEDYETKFFRLVMVRVVERGDRRTAAVRLDLADEQGQAKTEGLFGVLLTADARSCRARFLAGQASGAEFDRGMSHYGIELPFLHYPPVRGALPRAGEKAFALVEGMYGIRGYQTTPAADGAIAVEARNYFILAGASPPAKIAGLPWTEFYDPQANEMVAQPKQGRLRLPVRLDTYEIQEWDVGQPFWKRMSRYHWSGALIASCELLRRSQLPPGELEQKAGPPEAPSATGQQADLGSAKAPAEAYERANQASRQELMRKLVRMADEAGTEALEAEERTRQAAWEMSLKEFVHIAGASTAPGQDESGDQIPIAFGALGRLRTGDVLPCRLSLAKSAVEASSRTAWTRGTPPRRAEGLYDTKFVRLVVAKALKQEDGQAVVLRLDETDERGMPTREGLFDLELADGAEGCRTRLLSAGAPVSPGLIHGGIELPFLDYPPLRSVLPRAGEKVFTREGHFVRGYQATPADNGAITVQAREYSILGSVGTEEQTAKETWTVFFDSEANDLVTQPREGRDLLPVRLEASETQEWDVGQPFWRRKVRRTRAGTVIASCDVLGQPRPRLDQEQQTPAAREPAASSTSPVTAQWQVGDHWEWTVESCVGSEWRPQGTMRAEVAALEEGTEGPMWRLEFTAGEDAPNRRERFTVWIYRDSGKIARSEFAMPDTPPRKAEGPCDRFDGMALAYYGYPFPEVFMPVSTSTVVAATPRLNYPGSGGLGLEVRRDQVFDITVRDVGSTETRKRIRQVWPAGAKWWTEYEAWGPGGSNYLRARLVTPEAAAAAPPPVGDEAAARAHEAALRSELNTTLQIASNLGSGLKADEAATAIRLQLDAALQAARIPAEPPAGAPAPKPAQPPAPGE